MKLRDNKVILVDADGVLLDWEWAFNVWMGEQGFERIEGSQFIYYIGERYGIPTTQSKKLVNIFNNSAWIGFLPGLRDAQFYVKKLHEEYGFTFHLITSLSLDKNAQKLRTMNIDKLFGTTAFTKYVYLGTGADKDDALKKYKGTGLYWVEDKPKNCEAGLEQGLKPLLIEHGHNMDYRHDGITTVKNWRHIHDLVTHP